MKFQCYFLSFSLYYFPIILQSEFVAALMVSGSVHVVADSGDDRIEVVSGQNGYNDGEWHVLSVSKNGRK